MIQTNAKLARRPRSGQVVVALLMGVTAGGAGAQPYDKVQLLGFPVMTGYDSFVGPNGVLYFNDVTSPVGAYAGSLDAESDVSQRLGILEAAITSAAASPALDPSSGTLKVFLAPEFTWRPKQGAYNATSPAFLSIGDRFAALVADESSRTGCLSRDPHWRQPEP